MKYLLTILPILFATAQSTTAQTIKPLIDTQNYVFIAQTVQPLAGSERRLTINTYFLKITKDKIESNLPYTGHMTVASTDAMANALNISTGKFSYSVMPARKNGWRVLIKTKDATYLDELKLSINADGSARLQASFNGLDDISFAGMVVDPSLLPVQ